MNTFSVIIFLLSSLGVSVAFVFLLMGLLTKSLRDTVLKSLISFAVMCVICIGSLIMCGATVDDTTSQNASTENQNGLCVTTTDIFLEEVKYIINDLVEQDEKIQNVKLENGILYIFIDLSSVDTQWLTYEDIMISRTSAITDVILELTQYENMWNAITVDYGVHGYICNEKANKQRNEYGFYFFPSAQFEIENQNVSDRFSSENEKENITDTSKDKTDISSIESIERIPSTMIKVPQEEYMPVYGEPSAEQETSTMYIINIVTQKFHYANCFSVDDMVEENKLFSNQSRDEIIAEGYVPCQRCTP